MDDKENSGRGSIKRSKRDKVKYDSSDADLDPSFCMTIHCTLKTYSRVYFFWKLLTFKVSLVRGFYS